MYPLTDFGAVLDDDARDQQWRQLVTRLTADWPDVWSKVREDDVEDQIKAALPTDEVRRVFYQLGEHYTTKATILESAAYLVRLEVGRRAQGQPPDDDLTPALRATLARGDCLARFAEVERFLDFMSSFALIAAQSHSELPINSAGMDHLSTVAGDAGLTLRKLRQEFEAADGGAR